MKKLSSVVNDLPCEDDTNKKELVELPENIERQLQFHIDSVPPKSLKSLNGYNLKKIKSFKIIRKKYKQSNQMTMFIQDLQVILNEYDPSKFQLDTDMLIHICNIAEQYFIYGNKNEREEQKLLAISTLMKPYFKNDNELLEKMMYICYDKVEKSTILKRLYRKFINRFLK
jgi:hypothetical protein